MEEKLIWFAMFFMAKDTAGQWTEQYNAFTCVGCQLGLHVPATRTCFHCGAEKHLTRECPTPLDLWNADVLDEVVHQLGNDLLIELLAWLSTSASLPLKPEARDAEPEGFPCLAE
jgi:hypothetical protein